ncbi:MAG TPA: HEAT repeat domain-containing protein [Kofleriaceae bacterium]|nr:HEAT repeat domain-containing protein [Kofleriaceae bacterium]
MRGVAIALFWLVELTGIAAAGPDAVDAARRAVVSQPRDPTLHVRLAEALVDNHDVPGAISAYEAAIALDGKPAAPRLALSALYVQAGDPRRAAAVLHEVVRSSTDAEAVLQAGRSAINIEQTTGTLGELEQVIVPLAARPAHRQLLVALYLQWLPQLEERARKQDGAARRELTRIATTAQPVLIAALEDPDPVQQWAALGVLEKIGAPAAAPALVKLAHSPPKPRPGHVSPISLDSVQARALVVAGRTGNRAVFADVLPLLKHAEIAVRDAAIFAVARLGDGRAIAPLLGMLDERRTSSATLACLGLTGYRDPRVGRALLAVVADTERDDVTRAACAYAAGAARLGSAVPVLTRALAGNGELPRLAAWGLGQLAQPAMLGPLITAYFAHGGQKRRELEVAIAKAAGVPVASAPEIDLTAYPLKHGQYDPVQAVSRLPGELPRPEVPDRVFGSQAAEIARALAAALASPDPGVLLGALDDLDANAEAVGFGVLTPRSPDGKLRAALATVVAKLEPALRGLLANRDPKVRVRALSVLAKAVGTRAEPAILAAMDDQVPQVREGAMAAIVQLARGNPVPEPLRTRLARTLTSAAWADQRAAALAIGKLGAAADVGALVAAAGSSSAPVREAVATSLGAIGGPATLDALLRLSRDEAREVRAAAARGLRRLPDPRARQRTQELISDPDPQVRSAAHS